MPKGNDTSLWLLRIVGAIAGIGLAAGTLASSASAADDTTEQRLLNAAKEVGFDYRVHIVQPGISKQRLAAGQMDLLGATENYLQETYSISLDVIASA